MSKELILRFGTRNLKKAQAIADKIAKRAREAGTEGVKATKAVAALIKGNEAAIKRGSERRERERRSFAFKRDLFGGGRDETNAQLTFRTNAQRVAERGLAGISAARALAQGNLLAGATFLATFIGGPAGVVAQAATMAVEIVRPLIAAEAKRQRDVAFAQIDARFSEAIKQLDVERRRREDPEFAEEQAIFFGRIVNSIPQRTLRPGGGLDGF